MAVLAAKNQTERNKMIAAGVLGVVALVALYFAFGRSLFSSSATTTITKGSPTPKPNAVPAANRPDTALPSASEQDFVYQTTPVVYNSYSGAPDPGRNIFAFFEPPPPTPYVAPIVTPKPVIVPTLTPAPTPVYLVQSANPAVVYAGSQGFRIEVGGDRFTPDSNIYFNQAAIPTTFVSPQRLTADIPANLIAQEGPKQIIVQNPNGTAFSNPYIFNVQAPPKPTLQYIGMIGRKRYNNDTAYFTETGRPDPFGARLNDVVNSRFRLIDISPAQVVLEDTQLGFKYRILLTKTPVTGGNGQPGRPPGFPDGFTPFNPGDNPPGIPGNIQRYVPPPTPQKQQKQDVDDDGDGGK